MSQLSDTHFSELVALAAGVPVAGCAAMLIADGFYCGPGHAAFTGLFIAMPIFVAAGVVISISALVLNGKRGNAPMRQWRVLFGGLAAAASIGGLWLGFSFTHGPLICHIEF